MAPLCARKPLRVRKIEPAPSSVLVHLQPTPFASEHAAREGWCTKRQSLNAWNRLTAPAQPQAGQCGRSRHRKSGGLVSCSTRTRNLPPLTLLCRRYAFALYSAVFKFTLFTELHSMSCVLGPQLSFAGYTMERGWGRASFIARNLPIGQFPQRRGPRGPLCDAGTLWHSRAWTC